MILYHFTALEFLEGILREGLRTGDVPTAPTASTNAVWLTAARRPKEHYPASNCVPSDQQTMDQERLSRTIPLLRGRPADMHAVRIAVKIARSDRNLVYWPQWAHTQLSPEWRNSLRHPSRGGKSPERNWWLYFGVIKPKRFRGIELLSDFNSLHLAVGINQSRSRASLKSAQVSGYDLEI